MTGTFSGVSSTRRALEKKLVRVGSAGTAVGENRILLMDAATQEVTVGQTYSTLEKASFVARMAQDKSNYTKNVYVFSKYSDGTSAIWIDAHTILWSGRSPKARTSGGTFGGLLSGGTSSCIEQASEEAMKSLGHRKAADFDTQNLLVSWYSRGKACAANLNLKLVSAETANQAMYFATEQAEIHVNQWVPDTSSNETVRGSAARHAMSAFREGFKATVYTRLVDKMRGGSLGDSISAKKLRGGRVAFTRTVSKKELAELKRVMKRVLK